MLARYSDFLPVIEEVDIDSDNELLAQFDTCVPVVELDGQVRFRGRVNEVLLRRLIHNATAQQPVDSDAVGNGPVNLPTGSELSE